VCVLATGLAVPATGAESRAFGLVVTDALGQFVSDLRAEEVRVLENGEARELTSFELDSRRLAAYLVLDTSEGAGRVFRTQAYDAVWGFVQGLPEGTSCILWSTGERARKLGPLGGERKDVDKKVGQAFAIEGPNALMDTVVEAAQALSKESGKRRALVVLSGTGAGHTSYSPVEVATEGRRPAAQVIALFYGEGEAANAGSLRLGDSPRDVANLQIVGGPDHERIVSGLARATGGRYERVPSALGAGTAFAGLAGELGGLYRLGYAPGEVQGARRVEARVSRPGVRWRVTLDNP
jgi:hypothetical protein